METLCGTTLFAASLAGHDPLRLHPQADGITPVIRPHLLIRPATETMFPWLLPQALRQCGSQESNALTALKNHVIFMDSNVASSFSWRLQGDFLCRACPPCTQRRLSLQVPGQLLFLFLARYSITGLSYHIFAVCQPIRRKNAKIMDGFPIWHYKGEPPPVWRRFPAACRKSFFASLNQFSKLSKVLKTVDFNGAGHPSWVSRAHSSLPSINKGRHGFDGQKCPHTASSPLRIRHFPAGLSLSGHISAPAKLQSTCQR